MEKLWRVAPSNGASNAFSLHIYGHHLCHRGLSETSLGINNDLQRAARPEPDLPRSVRIQADDDGRHHVSARHRQLHGLDIYLGLCCKCIPTEFIGTSSYHMQDSHDGNNHLAYYQDILLPKDIPNFSADCCNA